MNISHFLSCTLIVIGLNSCFAPDVSKTKNTLSATGLHPYGRSVINKSGDLELITSGAHFGFTFEGDQCQVFFSTPEANGHNYFQYEIDGVYGKRIRVDGNENLPHTITTSEPGRHTIYIYKATEAHTGALRIEKIAGKNVQSLITEKKFLIEFIGNSITCGAAADSSEVPCGKGEYHDQHNAYFSYGPRVARALNFNFILSSVSGTGIYRNWNSDSPTLPHLYAKTDFRDNSNLGWDFNLYNPGVVCIALGTNDLHNGDGIKKRLPFDSSLFILNYIKFVQFLKSKYPGTRVVLLSSPILHGNQGIILQYCLTVVKKNIDALFPADLPVGLYFFKPMIGRGCTGHPSVEDHAILAAELIPFIKGSLGK